jgi:hypothetical protein
MVLPKELRLWENPTPQPARVLIVSLRASSAVLPNPTQEG